jgi:hypothetical protein
MPAKPKPDFDAVYAQLKAIIQKYDKGTLKATTDRHGHLVLVGPPTEASQGKEVWFGPVQMRKNYS